VVRVGNLAHLRVGNLAHLVRVKFSARCYVASGAAKLARDAILHYVLKKQRERLFSVRC
jgi:hypothetical protein